MKYPNYELTIHLSPDDRQKLTDIAENHYSKSDTIRVLIRKEHDRINAQAPKQARKHVA